MFELGCFPLYPVIDAVKKLGRHISFVFGGKDWMDSTGAEVLITTLTKGHYVDECHSQLHIIEGAEHQIQNDKPHELAQLMIDDLLGKIRGRY